MNRGDVARIFDVPEELLGSPRDLVYVVRPGDVNEELRYSLRSVAANLPHGRVWIAGYRPSWVRNVGHIPTPYQGRDKYAIQTWNLLAACEHPDVSREFVLMNDDFFVVRAITHVPMLHGGPCRLMAKRFYEAVPQGSGYITAMQRNAEELETRHGISDPLCYDLHVPMPVMKNVLAVVLRSANSFHQHVHKRTTYGNLAHVGGTEILDCKVSQREDEAYDRIIMRREDPPFLSTNDETIWHYPIGRWLFGHFTKPCVYEDGKPGPYDGAM